jgi:muconolactone delta-isomerase
MIIEAEDNLELDRMLASLPMMGVYDVDVAPVQRIGSALERDRRIVQETRTAAGL